MRPGAPSGSGRTVDEALPDLLGDEGHAGVQQPQRAVEDVDEHRQRRAVAVADAHLGHLDVPVGELVPEEVAHLAHRLAELELAEQLVDRGDQPLRARQDPAVLERQCRARQRASVEVVAGLDHREHEARGVPQLVGEVAARLDALVGDALVVAGRGAGDERVAQRVGAVAVDRAAAGRRCCPSTSTSSSPRARAPGRAGRPSRRGRRRPCCRATA